jgi:hypothetical protein
VVGDPLPIPRIVEKTLYPFVCVPLRSRSQPSDNPIYRETPRTARVWDEDPARLSADHRDLAKSSPDPGRIREPKTSKNTGQSVVKSKQADVFGRRPAFISPGYFCFATQLFSCRGRIRILDCQVMVGPHRFEEDATAVERARGARTTQVLASKGLLSPRPRE